MWCGQHDTVTTLIRAAAIYCDNPTQAGLMVVKDGKIDSVSRHYKDGIKDLSWSCQGIESGEMQCYMDKEGKKLTE